MLLASVHTKFVSTRFYVCMLDDKLVLLQIHFSFRSPQIVQSTIVVRFTHWHIVVKETLPVRVHACAGVV